MPSNSLEHVEPSILRDFLSAANHEALRRISDSIELQPGEYLFKEGQENHRVFVLLQGRLDLTMTVPGRGPTRILTLGAGELVAWSALLGDGLMTASAVCVESAQLSSVDCRVLKQSIEGDPKFESEFMTMVATALSRRLLATRLQLLDLFTSSP